jgi:hypothetical protein
MIHADIDSSTLAVTSMIMAAITVGFCKSMDVTLGTSIVIGAVVGVVLYAIGVIPIGLLVAAGIGMVIGIVKTAMKSSNPPD